MITFGNDLQSPKISTYHNIVICPADGSFLACEQGEGRGEKGEKEREKEKESL